MRSRKYLIRFAFYQKLLLILSGIVASLVMIELVLRFTNLIPRMDGDAMREEILWQENEVMLNSDGFRDDEFSEKKDYRIAILGDSIGFGWHVAQDKILPTQLENNLLVDVVNLSQFGINLKDEVNILKRQNDKLKPDLLILIITPNDVEIPPLPSRGANAKIPFDPIDHRLNRWTYTYVFIKNRLNLLLEAVGLRQPYLEWNIAFYQQDSGQWRRFTQAFDELDQLIKNRPIVVVMFPGVRDFKKFAWKKARSTIAAEASKRNYFYLDLVPKLSWYDPRLLRASDSDGHPNAQAHTLATQWVAEFLKENKLAPNLY